MNEELQNVEVNENETKSSKGFLGFALGTIATLAGVAIYNKVKKSKENTLNDDFEEYFHDTEDDETEVKEETK